MSLFRCSVVKKRNSNKFLDGEEIYAIGEILSKSYWFDHFYRTGGIKERGVTRFGPQGFAKWPLYASEKSDTTFYEYAYWKLKGWEGELNMLTRASLLRFEFNPTMRPVNVQMLPNRSKILNRLTYEFSHDWIQSLKQIPESIRYPSVRDPENDAINYAIFNGSSVDSIVMMQDLTLRVLDEDHVEIFLPNKMSLIVAPLK